jgi:arylsulfatase A-like enzyme
MRPDFITPENTPVLHAFGAHGTFFDNNHSFYVTTTEVNGTVLATGMFPRHSGIVANREYRPEINLMKPFATESASAVRIGDALSDGHYIDALTVAELVQKAGFKTAVAGTKPIGLLHDRNFDRAGKNGSVTLFAGKTYPDKFIDTLTAALGKWPDSPDTTDIINPKPNTAQNLWTTHALIDHLWRDGVPKYTVLWLGDPDFSQHYTAPGSPTALAGIHNSDTHFGLMLDALKARGVADKTDVVVVSDHGFSTIEHTVDLVAALKQVGIKAVREHKMTPAPGSVLVVNVGGTTSLYVTGHDPAVLQQCVDLLQTRSFAGPIFTKAGLPGTFSLESARLDSPHAPDITFSFRWNSQPNKYGAPGLIVGEAKRAGGGTHGTLGKSDVHNTLVAAGPDFHAGFRNSLPTGNIDVAPTILHLLGITPPEPRDGRVLAEALVGAAASNAQPETKRLEAERTIGPVTWRQYLQTTTFAGSTYFDEGNAFTK